MGRRTHCSTKVQWPVLHTSSNLKGFEVVAMVKRLTKKEHAAAPAQLASRIPAIMKFGAGAASTSTPCGPQCAPCVG